MEKAEVGKHCFLLHKPGSPRWRHI